MITGEIVPESKKDTRSPLPVSLKSVERRQPSLKLSEARSMLTLTFTGSRSGAVSAPELAQEHAPAWGSDAAAD
jgi:hypothetical protein